MVQHLRGRERARDGMMFVKSKSARADDLAIIPIGDLGRPFQWASSLCGEPLAPLTPGVHQLKSRDRTVGSDEVHEALQGRDELIAPQTQIPDGSATSALNRRALLKHQSSA